METETHIGRIISFVPAGEDEEVFVDRPTPDCFRDPLANPNCQHCKGRGVVPDQVVWFGARISMETACACVFEENFDDKDAAET
jgi:NAD-dependent SIR2 family protein deacetylase